MPHLSPRAALALLPFATLLLPALSACGGGAPSPAGAAPPATRDPAAAAASTPSRAGAGAPDPETAAAVFARVERELVGCYETGKKAVPAMLAGRATISVAIDGRGSATCVVVGDDTGLTQAVEDCMSARLSRETFAASGTPWTTELPILVKDGKLALGAASTAPSLDTVETHGLPDSAHDVVVSLVPRFRACAAESAGPDAKQSLRIVHVGARVAKDGHVACALASSSSPVPEAMRDCVTGVLASATFPPPTAPVGLVSVPLKVHGGR